MTDEHQERLEDYLELERYIEAWQAGNAAHPPTNLTPEQARIYQMATLFFSAHPEQAEPRLVFAEHLKEWLLLAREDQRSAASDPVRLASTPTMLSPSEPASMKRKDTLRLVHFFSRRHLLNGGAIAALFLVIGGGLEQLREHMSTHSTDHHVGGMSASRSMEITTAVPTTWHFVTTLADLGQGAVRFTSKTLIGYVLRDTSTPNGEKLIALSATCTHMGCLVQWKETDRRFHCPCHGALFAEDGANVTSRYRSALPPLPRLNTKIEHGKVYVDVPIDKD